MQLIHSLLHLTIKCVFTFALFVTFGICSNLAQAEETKKILIIHSYHKGLGWTDGISQGMYKTFEKSSYRLEIFTEYMDTKRIFNDRYLSKYSLFLMEKYNDRKFDVIVSSDDHAFHFLQDHQGTLFPGVPVVFCGVNYFSDEFFASKLPFTGVVESFSIKDTIDAALFINPHLKQVYSVVDNSVSGRANLKLLKQVIPGYHGLLQFLTITEKDMAEVLKEVSQLPENSIVLILAFTSDKSGQTFSLEHSADLITEASNRPVFSFWDFHLNHGILGGMITTGFSQGATAAELALKILSGKKAEDIPIIDRSPNRLIFDYNSLMKFDISLKRLPPGSTVINRPHSFYDAYKKVIIGTLLVVLVLSVLVVSLLVNVIQRRLAQKELIKHRDHLEELVEERTIELKKTNSALADSEERYKSLSDASFEGIVISAKGSILEANNTLASMFGYTPQELVGMEVINCIVEDQREQVKAKIQSEIEAIYETTGLKKDGATFPIAAQAKMFSYKGNRVRVTAIRDLSKQKKAEEEIDELKGLLPICSSCKKIRDDQGYWQQVEVFISKKSKADFSHSMCPVCVEKLYGKEKWFKKIKKHASD